MKGGQVVYSLLMALVEIWMRHHDDAIPLPSVFVNPSFPQLQIVVMQKDTRLTPDMLGYGLIFSLGKLFANQVWPQEFLASFVDRTSDQE